MTLFRKRPVEVEAFQPSPPEEDYFDLPSLASAPQWFRDGVAAGTVTASDGAWIIQTLEGVMFAKPGDYIIRGIKGELYPCRRDIFVATYEPVA